MSDETQNGLASAAKELIRAGQRMDNRGWVPATAGNLSCRLSVERIAITRSGCHKGFLSQDEIIEVDLAGEVVSGSGTPSAETLLHTQLYATCSSIGAVLHGHSVAATVLSLTETAPFLTLEGLELLKVFEGVSSHTACLNVPIFDNDQDMKRLSGTIAPALRPLPPAYILRGHGVYVWGSTVTQALARLEGLEFLLACELEKK